MSAELFGIMSGRMGASDMDNSVAIVGAGALGLVATKNLIEEGFEVITFEKTAYVGGLWHANSDSSVTSALVGTVSNGSKQASAFSDFPMPDCKSSRVEKTFRQSNQQVLTPSSIPNIS